jgi:hypothetical protein
MLFCPAPDPENTYWKAVFEANKALDEIEKQIKEISETKREKSEVVTALLFDVESQNSRAKRAKTSAPVPKTPFAS